MTQTLPDARVVSYSYDSNGNVTSITPPSRPSHSFLYNTLGLLYQYLPPALIPASTVNTTYSYNSDGQLTSAARPDGKTINFIYDATSGNLTNLNFTGGSRSFSYNQGLYNSANSEDSVYFSLQRSGEFISVLDTWINSFNSNVSYIFNSNFNVINESLVVGSSPSHIVSFTYDDDSLLTGAGDLILTRSATSDKISQITLEDVQENFSYSTDFGELENFSAKFNLVDLYRENFLRDNAGRITTKTIKVGSFSPDTFVYQHDSTGRLTDVTKNGSAHSSYSYDNNSNMISQTLNSNTINATYDDQDRLLTFGTKSFTYTQNGEVSTIFNSSTSTTNTFSYDVFGNLKQVILPSKTLNYKVDALNHRVEKRDGITLINRFIWDRQDRVVAISGSSGLMNARFIYGSKQHVPDYMIVGTVKYKIISNHLGSPVQVVNSSTGAIVQEISYDDFGNILSDSSPGFTPFGFAGCLYDTDTKLCRFGARDYDASIGRWLSKDPIRFGGGDTNLYGYVMQDPINWIDPSGLYLIDETGGSTPPEFRYSDLYRALQNDKTSVTFLGLNNNMNSSGLATHGGNQQLIQINPRNQLSRYDNIDTFFHEANHARLNINFNGRTAEDFDTGLLLPSINQRNNSCR